MYKEALESFQKDIDIGGPYVLLRAFQAHAYGHSGNIVKARAILAELQELAQHEYVSPAHIAMVYDGLPERDLEMEALQKAYEKRDTFLVHINDGYFYDSLRSDPRFRELEHKIGVLQ
jgi:hypothetical protein